MPSEEEITNVIKQLEEYWKRLPELRLGQLIVGAMQFGDVTLSDVTNRLFYIGDDVLLSVLEGFTKRVGR